MHVSVPACQGGTETAAQPRTTPHWQVGEETVNAAIVLFKLPLAMFFSENKKQEFS